MTSSFSKFSLSAPAKINLFLHVTGKRTDGYHTLQSAIDFLDFGDVLHFEPAENFSLALHYHDPFFEGMIEHNDNLITRTINMMAAHYNRAPNFKISVEKNIPIGAGLGGGSADAAAAIKGLLKIWDIVPNEEELRPLMMRLGADIPVCYHGISAMVEGVGELVKPYQADHSPHALLLYPYKFCSTAKIFSGLKPPYAKERNDFQTLSNTRNDLTPSATQHIPEIAQMIEILSTQQGCRLARMSGSGSACFGLFDDEHEMQKDAQLIKEKRPDIWMQTAQFLNS